jgi:hypothetical protein
MYRKRIIVLLIGLLCCALLTSVALALSSYNVEGFTIGSGGGPSQAGTYALKSFIIGQPLFGSGQSENHGGCIGFLCTVRYRLYLPIVMRGL